MADTDSFFYHEGVPIRILLIEDSPFDRELVTALLEKQKEIFRDIDYASTLEEGLRHLEVRKADVVLLDLTLPDSRSLKALLCFQSRMPQVPVIVLTSLDHEQYAVEAVRHGAQDYLVKDEVNEKLLIRSIRYAIERHQLQESLRSLTIVDELTGLYNRRGFLIHAEQQVKLANRTRRGFFLLFADLDDFKKINDNFGHPEGDNALRETAKILKTTFRGSDIKARMGGDEFAVIVIEAEARN
ncbi:MAG: diguanylate cyclase, partial [Candidatus Omnitrophica bacterium]|nr:diguanylate cyclase [Candidatus Omnitrophota bacterium]